MRYQIIVIIVMIMSLTYADTEVCKISAFDLNSQYLTSLNNATCGTNDCFTGKVLVTVAKSDKQITSLTFTGEPASPKQTYTVNAVQDQNTFDVTTTFMVQNDKQQKFNFMKQCSTQVLNNKKLITYTFQLQDGDYYQTFELTQTATPSPTPKPTPDDPTFGNLLIAQSSIILIGYIISLVF